MVDALVGRMQAVSINPARGACIPDAYVTEAVVDDAFLGEYSHVRVVYVIADLIGTSSQKEALHVSPRLVR